MMKIDKVENIKDLINAKKEKLKTLMARGKNYEWLFKMFSQISNRAIIDKGLSPLGFRVYCIIIMHLMKSEKCFPSYKTISEEANIKKRCAIYTVKNLIQIGYITKELRQGKTNYYIAKIK